MSDMRGQHDDRTPEQRDADIRAYNEKYGVGQTSPSAPLPEPEWVKDDRRHVAGHNFHHIFLDHSSAEKARDRVEYIDALRARLQEVHAGMREAIQQGNELFRQVTAAESRAAALQKQRDEEIDEFNAGCESYKNGVRLDDLPSTPHDQMGVGWAWAAIGPLQKDKERLDLIESKRATVYAAFDNGKVKHWVFVDETRKDRTGQVHKTLREALDAALSKESPRE